MCEWIAFILAPKDVAENADRLGIVLLALASISLAPRALAMYRVQPPGEKMWKEGVQYLPTLSVQRPSAYFSGDSKRMTGCITQLLWQPSLGLSDVLICFLGGLQWLCFYMCSSLDFE